MTDNSEMKDVDKIGKDPLLFYFAILFLGATVAYLTVGNLGAARLTVLFSLLCFRILKFRGGQGIKP